MRELEVYIYGKKVGTLFDDGTGISFLYSKEFKANSIEISPIKMNSKKEKMPYINKEYVDIYKGLAGVIYDSLPDSNGTNIMDRYFESKGLNPSLVGLLQRLSFIGDRGMGALEYRPKKDDTDNISLDIQTIKEIRAKEKELLTNKNKTTIDELMMHIIDQISPVGGAKNKMLVYFNEKNKSLKFYSNSKKYNNYEPYIIKFDTEDRYKQDTVNEYIFMSMARDSGINVPKFELLEEDGLYHYLICRFDRDSDNNKIHTSTASALLHKPHITNATSYEELLRLTYTITNSIEDVKELIRRVIFNFLALITDDHSKNFSFTMDINGKWRLAPAYDIIYGLGLGAMKHKTTLAGKNDKIRYVDVIKVANEYKIDALEVDKMVEDILFVLGDFINYAKKVNLQESDINGKLLEIKDRVDFFLT